MSKYNKSYEEYVEVFKSKCEELGRTIKAQELRRCEFDLPSDKWFVYNCPDSNVKTYRDFIEYLGYVNKYRKYNFEIAFEEFAKRGLYLPPQEYTSCAIPLKYICPRHPDAIQHKSLNCLLFDEYERGNGCNLCYGEARRGSGSHLWKGGISKLHIYLRDFLKDWKINSMKMCNYKCVITGDAFDIIHHLYSYNKILKETLDEVNIPIYSTIAEYTTEELDLLKTAIYNKHCEYPLGVCLTEELHKLFHNIYGKGDNTPEQFEEFKIRYNNGELINV